MANMARAFQIDFTNSSFRKSDSPIRLAVVDEFLGRVGVYMNKRLVYKSFFCDNALNVANMLDTAYFEGKLAGEAKYR